MRNTETKFVAKRLDEHIWQFSMFFPNGAIGAVLYPYEPTEEKMRADYASALASLEERK